MNDLISRADAIDALMAWEEDSVWDEECLKHRGEPFWISPSDVVENLPSAEPHDCNTCRYNNLKWHEEPCDSCTGGGKSNHWKPMAQQQWILCSERLPEENIPVLLGVRFKDDFKYFVTARMDYNYWTGLGRDIRGELAWMPLPEPYKG